MRTTGHQRASDTAVSTRSAGQTVGETVVAAVTDYKGIDELELDPPLYEAIDPDALDVLLKESRGSVQFDYWGCTVTVSHDGVVTVRDRERD